MIRAEPRASHLRDAGRWSANDRGGISYPTADSEYYHRPMMPLMTDESMTCRRWVPFWDPPHLRQARGYPPPLYVNRHIVFVVVSRTCVYSITGVSVLPLRAGFVGRETLAEGSVEAVLSIVASGRSAFTPTLLIMAANVGYSATLVTRAQRPSASPTTLKRT